MEATMARATPDAATADRLRPERLAAANINPVTRLATDYLNHFNNVVMLLELLPDMPDCAEEVHDWAPMTYDDYFRTSHFRERDLAIDAYGAADPCIRADFDAAVTHLDCAMAEALALVEGHDPTDPISGHQIRDFVRERLKPLISRVGGIINGPSITVTQPVDADASEAQAAVDELFP
jgi:hypothetical protein